MPNPKIWGTIRECVEFFETEGRTLTRQRVFKLLQDGRLGKSKLVETPRGNVWYIRKPFVIETRNSDKGGRPKKLQGV